jgi:uncharacterized membrane protein YbhN (UPF0104 family)
LRRRLLVLSALLLAGSTAVLAVPGLRAAAHRAASVNVGWLIGAIVLELASCVSFLAVFRRFFDELPAADARRLAWIEMGSGALLPGGGIGSLAAGGVLLARGGMSTGAIVEKSSGLFFLTSGTNVLALEGASLALSLGLDRVAHRLVLSAIPAAVGLAGVAVVVAIPRTRWLRRGRAHAARPVLQGIRRAERELLRPHWRLLGALGYLGFDIAVLGLTCAGVGHPIGVPALVLAYTVGYVANSLPVPGGIGVLEGGLVGALVLYGAPAAPATAAVLIYHAIAFWIPSLGGAVAYGISAATRRRAPRSSPAQVLERPLRYCEDHGQTAPVRPRGSARPLDARLLGARLPRDVGR